MTTRYPVLFEAEATGAVSAYAPDLPVCAAANTAEEAEPVIRDLWTRTSGSSSPRQLARFPTWLIYHPSRAPGVRHATDSSQGRSGAAQDNRVTCPIPLDGARSRPYFSVNT
jgi:hypothetical protein